MQNIFQFLKLKRSPRIKLPVQKGSLAFKNADQKTETKDYSRMPKSFDYTAYFGDNELENIPNEIVGEIGLREENIEIFFMPDPKYNEMNYLTPSQYLDCCIN
jgi:hypothetical protein